MTPPLLDPYHMENSVCSKIRQLIDHCILSPNLYTNVRHRLNVMSGLILRKKNPRQFSNSFVDKFLNYLYLLMFVYSVLRS